MTTGTDIRRRHRFHRRAGFCLCWMLLLAPAGIAAEQEDDPPQESPVMTAAPLADRWDATIRSRDSEEPPIPILLSWRLTPGPETGLQTGAFWRGMEAERFAGPSETVPSEPQLRTSDLPGTGARLSIGATPSIHTGDGTERVASGLHLGSMFSTLEIPLWKERRVHLLLGVRENGLYPGVRYREEFEFLTTAWIEIREGTINIIDHLPLTPRRADPWGNSDQTCTSPDEMSGISHLIDPGSFIPVEPPDDVSIPVDDVGKKATGSSAGGAVSRSVTMPSPRTQPTPSDPVDPPGSGDPDSAVYFSVDRVVTVLKADPVYQAGVTSAFSGVGFSNRLGPNLETFGQFLIESKRYAHGSSLTQVSAGAKWSLSPRLSILGLGGSRFGGDAPGAFGYAGITFRF